MKFATLAIVLAVAVSACSDNGSPTEPSGTAPFTKTDIRVGTGPAAASGNELTVNYTGWLYDQSKPDQKGLQFDSSVGRAPFTFTLGASDVIAAWDLGLVDLRVGGIRRLIVPPSLAYGGNRNGVIPAGATLVFDVELLSLTTTPAQ